MFLSYLEHKRACEFKRKERAERIAGLPEAYHGPLDTLDREILEAPVSVIVENVHSGKWTPARVLLSYGRKALKAHAATNCLTEVMISSADVWAGNVDINGPLAGMPVSMKDTVGVTGFDSCIGYSAWTKKPFKKDAALVRLLKDAGAIPFVKTNVPITLLSFESSSDVWGTTTNPYSSAFSPGGSTGGEAALLAYGGSRLGIGTDVAGSVRIPAHYSGIYTIRASMNRFLKSGNATSMPGQEGVPAVYSPMTRTLEDLETFWKAIFKMKPWTYDHSVLHLPWRDVHLPEKVKFGVLWEDGVVPPSPACLRALETVKRLLELSGHEVMEFNAPDPYEGLQIASQLLLADGGKTAFKPIRFSESNDPGMNQAHIWFALPSLLKKLYAWWWRYIRRDEIYARLLENWREKTVEEYLALIAQREDYRARWFDAWENARIDFLLTVPNALPAVPHKGMKYGFKVCGYSFIFNLLDYTCGVLPVSRVNSLTDALSSGQLLRLKNLNAVARDAYNMYDAKAMHGLPIGIQIVGKRLEEEKVLEGMKLVERIVRERGTAFDPLKI